MVVEFPHIYGDNFLQGQKSHTLRFLVYWKCHSMPYTLSLCFMWDNDVECIVRVLICYLTLNVALNPKLERLSKMRITKRNLLSTLLVIKIYWNFIHITLCKGVASTPFTLTTPGYRWTVRKCTHFVENYIAVKLLFYWKHRHWVCWYVCVWVWLEMCKSRSDSIRFKIQQYSSECRVQCTSYTPLLHIELSIFNGLMAMFHVSCAHSGSNTIHFAM